VNPFFYLLAAMTLGGAVAAMTLRNAVHCALSLVVTFIGLAGVYLALGAQFLGLTQVLLLTRSGDGPEVEPLAWKSALLGAGAVVGILLMALLAGPGLPRREDAPSPPAVKELGEALMTDYVLPLQVVGVLLTVAMIGAAVLALPESQRRAGGGGKQ
jgi:NADH-quinone oxidoreductase subunit J